MATGTRYATCRSLPTLCLMAVLLVNCGGPSFPAPSGLVATPVQTQWVHLSWLDNTNDEEGFRIYRDDGAGGALVELTTVPADFFGYDDMTVTDGLFYTYYVVAYKGTTESAHSNHVVIEAGEPYVTILTPGDGEVLTLGDTYNITWVTNVPDFDARVCLDTNGDQAYPPEEVVQFSWPTGSPYPWKVGYKNTEEDPTKTPVWVQVIGSDSTCKIFIRHYVAVGAQDWSDGTFTILVSPP